MKIIFIYGGKSEEHDISLLSSYSMLQELYYDYYEVQLIFIARDGAWVKGPVLKEAPQAKEKLDLSYEGFENDHGYQGEVIAPFDIYEKDAVIFPLLHGPNGEDGTIQGGFEILDMPYVGCGVLASACCMDKIMTKHILQQTGVPQLPYVPVAKLEWMQDEAEVCDRCEGSLVYPMFVKPANLGSSVGISKAENREELVKGIKEAFRYDRRVVIEQGIEAREVEVAVLGNEEVRTTEPGEIVKEVAFYDFDAKYINNEVQLQIPAQLDQAVIDQLREYAKNAYITLDAAGLCRCDFFVTKDNQIFLNEINTMPGFTPFSMYPLLWKNMGLEYGDLLEELIQLAKNRYAEKKALI